MTKRHFQIKEEKETPEKELTKMEGSELPDTKFKTLIKNTQET